MSEKRKIKKEVKKVLKKETKKVVRKVRERKPGPYNKKRGAMAKKVLPKKNAGEMIAASNLGSAAAFVKSELDPTSGPARYPDIDPLPTSLCESDAKYDFSFITDASNGNAYFIILILPRLTNQVQVAATVSSGAITWANAADDPNLAFLTANAVRNRVNGLSAKITNFEPYLDRGGRIYYGNVVSASASGASITPPATIAAITGNQSLKLADLAKSKEIVMPWLPADSTAHFFRAPSDTGGAGTWDEWLQNGILFFVSLGQATGAVAAPFTATIEVHANHEYIPLPAVSTTLDPQAVVGDPNLTAGVLDQALMATGKTENPSAQQSNDGFFAKAGKWIEKNIPLAENVVDIISDVGGIFGAIGGLFAAEHRLHYAHHLVYAGMYVHAREVWLSMKPEDRPEWEPIAQAVAKKWPSPYLEIDHKHFARSNAFGNTPRFAEPLLIDMKTQSFEYEGYTHAGDDMHVEEEFVVPKQVKPLDLSKAKVQIMSEYMTRRNGPNDDVSSTSGDERKSRK